MKYKALRNRFGKLIRKQEKGKTIKPKKVAGLLRELLEKKKVYENRLQQDLKPGKRKSLEIKLSVVNAHIDKLRSHL